MSKETSKVLKESVIKIKKERKRAKRLQILVTNEEYKRFELCIDYFKVSNNKKGTQVKVFNEIVENYLNKFNCDIELRNNFILA